MNSMWPGVTADGAFSVCFVAAFAVGLALLYAEGRRRGWLLSSWLVLVASVVTLGIVGSRLGAISLAGWRTALAHGSLPTTTGKTFIGLVILGTGGALLVQRFLGFRSTTVDASAIVLPIGMAVARLGCLFGGCCFGRPTCLPWAITYPAGSLAAAVHELRGMVLPGHTSHSVHPVQLYEIILLVFVALALVRARPKLKQPGSLFLLYLVLHGWVRFLIEFAREGTLGPTLAGLRPLQVGLLMFCAGCGVLLVFREKATLKQQPAPVASPARNVAVLGALAVLLWVFGGWFTPVEQFVLAGACLPAGFATAFGFVRSTRHAWQHRAALAAASASFILLGAGSDTLPAPDIGRLSYNDVTLSGGNGSYEELCGGTYRYNQLGAGIARTERWDRFTRVRFGVQGYRYSSPEAFYHPNGEPYLYYGVRPFIGGETRWAGLELGAVFSELSGAWMEVVPSGRLRIGASDVVYAEAAVYAHEIGRRPYVELGLGTSHWEWGSLHAGICEEGIFFAPEVRTNQGLSVSPFVAYGNRNNWHFDLRLRYSFSDFLRRPLHRGEY
jgi:prolipoprotein diacylglyceryltransferase